MSWIEVSLDTTHEAVDWVNTLLATIDYTGEVNITNHIANHDNSEQQACNDPIDLIRNDLNSNQDLENQDLDSQDLDSRNINPSPWECTVRLYVADGPSAPTQVEQIQSLFSPLHRTGMATVPQVTVLEEKPEAPESPDLHRIGQHFVVLTSQVVDSVLTNPTIDLVSSRSIAADEILIKLGRLRAFGSGLHPTTILSLKLLERYISPEMNVLDLGSGSGILSVAMAKLGATVLAIDNDGTAVAATQDTVRRNRVEAQVTVMQASLGAGSDLGHWMNDNLTGPVATIETNANFDLIVANIFARIQLALIPDFCKTLHPSGYLISAGFTTDYEEEIVTAFTQAGFEMVDCERYNEWVAFAFRLGDTAILE